MASPFFDAISAGVSSAPGTGTFTIGTVTSGFRAFSNVPANTIVQYRAEEGTAWEIGMGLWNGSTLTRKVMYSSASDALVSFTAAAVLSLTISADRVALHPGIGSYSIYMPTSGSSYTAFAGTSTSSAGTWNTSYSNTGFGSYSNQGMRLVGDSATTANAQVRQTFPQYWKTADYSFGAKPYAGGYEVVFRMGIGVLPTGSRFCFGLNQYTGPSGWTGSAEPVAQGYMGGSFCFTKSSTQSNFQWVTGSGGNYSEIDTGVTAAAGAVYEVAIWQNPVSTTTFGYLAKLGTSEIWFGSDLSQKRPNGNSDLSLQIAASLSSTTGTAVQINTQAVYLRTGF